MSEEQQPLLNHSPTSENTTSRSQCAEVIRNEFHLQNFGLEFDPQEVFYNCQWHWPKGVYLLYRIVLLAYSLTVLILSVTLLEHNRWQAPWPIFLTHWSYLMLTAHLLVSALISVLHAFDAHSSINRIALNSAERGISHRRVSTPIYMKLSWLLFVIASGSAFVVSCIYFAALFPQRGISYLSVVDVNLHLMNSVLVILEFMISAMPVRLFHFVYHCLYGLVYVVFSIIYWSVDHEHVIYPGVLDWNHPGKTTIFMLLLAFIGIPLIQSFLFGLYSLRLFIYRKIYFRHSY